MIFSKYNWENWITPLSADPTPKASQIGLTIGPVSSIGRNGPKFFKE